MTWKRPGCGEVSSYLPEVVPRHPAKRLVLAHDLLPTLTFIVQPAVYEEGDRRDSNPRPSLEPQSE